jgi:uncharacterized membrane protein
MSDQYGNIPPEPTYTSPPPPPVEYTHAPPPPPGYTQAPPAAGSGLSDTAAGALAYVTIIPAIIFLVMEPYNKKPFVKFHSFQCLGLAVGWVVVWIALAVLSIVLHFIPLLGFLMILIYPLVGLGFLVLWLLCILKASQGGAFKLPVIGNFAAQQSGYNG